VAAAVLALTLWTGVVQLAAVVLSACEIAGRTQRGSSARPAT